MTIPAAGTNVTAKPLGYELRAADHVSLGDGDPPALEHVDAELTGPLQVVDVVWPQGPSYLIGGVCVDPDTIRPA